jgi:hypothetical protein
MFFDLTKEIKLDKKSYLHYRYLQIIFYVICLLASLYIIYLILFPTQEFNFSFISLNKGNVINPRNEKGILITDGRFSAKQDAYFDASLVGSFSEIKLNFTPKKQSATPENSRIDLRKSYRAFLYPEGLPIGFKNGTLLKKGDDFFLVSEGKLRKFASLEIAETLGFSSASFFELNSNADLKYNPLGEEIIDTKNYPIDSIFKIKGDYYILSQGKTLEKFISEKAFLGQYDKNLAISKNADFLNDYSKAERPLGFADGTLVSYGLSVFVTSKNKLHPIGDPDIFLNQGYNWNDIIAIDGNEFSIYEKEKLFNLASAHPDGTVFFTPDTNKWYRIENKQKHELPSKKIADSWLKKNPVIVPASSLQILGSCNLEKKLFGNYSCSIPLNDNEETAGRYYEFTFVTKNDLVINNLNLLYEKDITTQNLKLALRNMIFKIKTRYGIQSAPPQ